jgi:hypothetical protein
MTRSKTPPYTQAEDLLLLRLRNDGEAWADMAHAFPGRTPASLRGRYGQIAKTQDRPPIATIDPGDFKTQCERHARIIMRHGGFCAFSDNGDKRGAFGITLPMIWPQN